MLQHGTQSQAAQQASANAIAAVDAPQAHLHSDQNSHSASGPAAAKAEAGRLDSTAQLWSMLADGALPLACQGLESGPDAVHKYHSLMLLATGLQQAAKALEVLLSSTRMSLSLPQQCRSVGC